MKTTTILYQDETTTLEGFSAYSIEENRPLVILCHAWAGRDPFICEKAQEIASLGYTCFALDMYGKGILGKTKEENAALKKPFIQNRDLLQKRVLKGFERASSLPYVNKTQIAVLGLGFGGLCALDLARSGVNIKGVVSFYGHFDSPPAHLLKPIKAKILILHGYNDLISPPHELALFEQEMNQNKVDWQTYLYGNTGHAFANPHANDAQSSILYNSVSAKRAWLSTFQFLQEIFE